MAVHRLNKEDNTTPINGSFTTTLKTPLTMEDGDTLIVRDCFIDTKNTVSGKITIEKPLDLKMSFHLFFNDWYGDYSATVADDSQRLKNFYSNATDGNTQSGLAYPSNKKWIPGEIVAGGAVGAYHELKSVTFTIDTNKRPDPNAHTNPGEFGGFGLIVHFTDANGHPNSCTVPIRSWPYGSGLAPSDPQTTTVEQYGVGSGFNITDPAGTFFNKTNMTEHCIKDIVFNTVQMAGEHFVPDTQPDATCTLPPGKYSPTDIANEISRRLAVNNSDGGSHLVHSPFLKTKLTWAAGKKFIREDGLDIAELSDHHNYFVGTSQVALNYSEVRNSFYWSYLHMPIYSGDEESAYVNVDSASNHYIGKSNSGIIIKSLHPPEFWQNVLGFGENCNYAPGIKTADESFRGQSFHSLPLFSTASPGVNYTEALDTIDNVVSKGEGTFMYPPATPFYVTQEDTAEILAINTVKVDTLPDAYFMVQLKCKLFSNLINATDVYKNIQAIVSRYQTIGNYTSTSGGQSSIVYTHSGSDIMLSSFEIAILDPNFKNSDNIGSDNTVFIEVVKPPKHKI